jgi:hypothetical protein
MSATWDELRALRANGLQPAMRLVVTTNKRFAWNLDSIGVMAIVHTPGEPMPVELLEGLEVLFMFSDCGQSAAVLRLCNQRGVTLAWYRCWCECESLLTTLALPCSKQDELRNWIGDKAA